MGLFSRIKEAWKDIEESDDEYEELPPDAKPKGQATVVQDDPVEIFPPEEV